MKLSKREGEVVDEAHDLVRRYAEPNMSMVSSTQFPLRVIRRCIAKGLLEEVGEVVMVDGDGFAKEPERYRPGFRLTDEGRRIATARADAEGRWAMKSMRIESHDDDSVTLTVGSITARIKGDSWKDANKAASALGYLVLASYEASNIRTLLEGCRSYLDELEQSLRSTEHVMKGITDYADAISKVRRPETPVNDERSEDHG